jgi:phytanoyl-CoA hydroxylase
LIESRFALEDAVTATPDVTAPTADLPPPCLDESDLLDLTPEHAVARVDDLPLTVRFHLRPSITPIQSAFLDRHGFLVFDRVASRDELDTILAEVERIEAELLESGERSLYGVPVWFGADPEGAPMLQRLGFTSTRSPWLKAFVTDTRFEPVRKLIGDEARIGHEEKDGVVFNRYVQAEGSLRPKLGWHTDALRDVFYNGAMPGPMLNVGLHFDRITEADGGLRVLPGTHTQSAFSTLFRKIHFVSQKADRDEILVETWPGDLTVHDGRMWHRVQESSKAGWDTLRRSMYVPYVVDAYAPKNEASKPLLYHRVFDAILKLRGAR